MLEFFRAYKQETFALLGLQRGTVVADIGCGTGEDARNLAQIAGEAGSVVGFDISDEMLTVAEHRRNGSQANLRFIRAPADDLGVAGETFDAVRADRVLTHVPDPAAAIAEMARVLKPGGRLAVISFQGDEDRIVRELFKTAAKEKKIEWVKRATIRPSWAQIKENPRSRSAKMKVVQKI